MKHRFNINHNGQTKKVTIEPSIYQDKHLYEVVIDGNYFMLYRRTINGNTTRSTT